MEEGDFVKINYTGKIEDNIVFDTTSEEVAEENNLDLDVSYGAKTIILGAGHMVDGLEQALFDAEIGEENKVEVPPELGFGERKDELVRSFPKREFEKKYQQNPQKGMQVEIEGRKGVVISVVGGKVRVDFNHPLAGETLNYEYTVEEIIEEDEEKIKALISLFVDNLTADEFDLTLDEEVEIKVPRHANYNMMWIYSKPRIVENIIEYMDYDKVRLIEEYTDEQENLENIMDTEEPTEIKEEIKEEQQK
ncbi:FKBP-type peptidyl-prolyl cis-trans isomerase 2 [Methanonatronarchaeum thermophilum]|uniref:Peptidyl-prolyl cis-trans isomerase n=1 Tax=Methanonatronarchaeum thermophilum TaxID=1927129 RepID=A0A1Y3GBV7_9EURY|nr:peptidylprolyl isomerase [Methanonatronarchaeum thermophilum]OUJ18952.1 FKBP-type peptidyl-prolyl cis-trans isomerase 2 [Methanonatronarchaeum thermophilum]